MSQFIASIRKLATLAYPLTTPSEKATCALATTCKASLFTLSLLKSAGFLATAPYLGWIHVGLGAASLGLHLAGGLRQKKIGLAKELIETLPLLALGTLNGLGLLSTAKMSLGSLISLSTATGLYWGVAPMTLANWPTILSYGMGDAKNLEEENADWIARLGGDRAADDVDEAAPLIPTADSRP